MALEFTDFGVSPDESVKQRQKALESYTNVAEPAYKEQVGRERGQLASDAYSAAAKSAYEGKPTADVTAEATAKAAEMIPGQALKQQEMDITGAKMREDVIGSKQTQAITNFERNTAEMKEAAARYIAKQAFAQGMTAKELAMHRNGTIADIGLAQLSADFQAGRVSEYEIRQMSNELKLYAMKATQALKEKEAFLTNQVQQAINAKDYDAAAARAKVLFDAQKEAMRAQNEAKATADIFSAVGSIAGAAIGTLVAPGLGTAAGATIGGSLGNIAGAQ